MGKLKKENQILIMLAFFSISVGLWENFNQLWLQDNHFSIRQISSITSIGTIVSVVGILFVGKYITLEKLKNFISYALLLKLFNLLVLYFLNGKNCYFMINVSIIIDTLCTYLIITSIYPLIVTIIKSNKVYSKRKLTEYLFRDLGILVGGILIGRTILGVFVNYNICLFISILFLLISIAIMASIKENNANKVEKKQKISVIPYIAKNKILLLYLGYLFVGAVAYSTALGLKMLTFTNYLNFSDSEATNYLLVIGLIADIIGIIALKYLTPKNDYITITIKFGIRMLAYLIAFLSNNVIITLASITWSILISTAYENVCDGYYVNAVDNEYQLTFTNFRYAVKYFGDAIGIFLCGIMYEKGLRYMFGLSSFLMVFQIIVAYRLIYLRKKNVECEKK